MNKLSVENIAILALTAAMWVLVLKLCTLPLETRPQPQHCQCTCVTQAPPQPCRVYRPEHGEVLKTMTSEQIYRYSSATLIYLAAIDKTYRLNETDQGVIFKGKRGGRITYIGVSVSEEALRIRMFLDMGDKDEVVCEHSYKGDFFITWDWSKD